MTVRPVAGDFELAADVLVIGGGPAGSWAAIAAVEAGASVILAEKGRVGTSGATAAANTAVIDVARTGPARAAVIERRLVRGLGLAQADWIERMLDETHAQLGRLAEWGYAFACDDRGVVYRGALRGPDYMQLLRRRLLKLGVRLLDHSPALHLIISDGEAVGASGVARGGTSWTVRSGAVVIATGGCAFMSKALGTYGLTGDGLLMGAEAGAVLSGMEFSGQYGISHAAATVTKNLIFDWATFSDAGGQILEGDDIFELLARNLPQGPVYAVIDRASPFIQAGLRCGQPNIFLPLDRLGIDPFRERFPVTLRYEGTVRGVGGLLTDAGGATSVPGLYAAGDAASREPVVGATSGGGGPNSTWAIASGLWAGRSAAARAATFGARARQKEAHSVAGNDGGSGAAIDPEQAPAYVSVAQAAMFPLERNFTRDAASLRDALERLDEARRSLSAAPRSRSDARSRRRERETAAMLAAAHWICTSALERRETRGIHRRRDFPSYSDGPPRSLRLRGVDDCRIGWA
ncbi:MAG: FAD-binding protein [Hyphomicrobiales bacterium]|nr:FAD-binding protein [Hyphomicrobiales bacterium]